MTANTAIEQGVKNSASRADGRVNGLDRSQQSSWWRHFSTRRAATRLRGRKMCDIRLLIENLDAVFRMGLPVNGCCAEGPLDYAEVCTRAEMVTEVRGR
jgi:hypothetical protein